MFLFVITNLFDGERGLISYYDKKNTIEQLFHKNQAFIDQLDSVEKKNNLLTDVVDVDYLETLYRKKFIVGKTNEKVYISNKQ